MDWQHDPYHGLDEEQDITEMIIELNLGNEDVVFHTIKQDTDEEVVDKKEHVGDEDVVETEYEGVGEGDDSDL